MKVVKSDRGFRIVVHPTYLGKNSLGRVFGESSAVGNYDDSLEKPGSSYLWVGEHHHLNREEVAELIGYMQTWIDAGRLPEPANET